MINQHLMKSNMFRGIMSKKRPFFFLHLPFASLITSFLYLLLPASGSKLSLCLPFSDCSLNLYWLMFFPFYSELFSCFFFSCVPRLLLLHFEPWPTLFLFLQLHLYIKVAANLEQGYQQRAGPGFTPQTNSWRNKQFGKSAGFRNLHYALAGKVLKFLSV